MNAAQLIASRFHHASPDTIRLNYTNVIDNHSGKEIESTSKKQRAEKSKLPNKTEQFMLDLLAAKKRRGEILDYRYEGISLRWGVNAATGAYMTYTPDVIVFDAQGILLIEVKGAHIRDRDIVRFRGCRAEWPHFRFEMWKFEEREWKKIL